MIWKSNPRLGLGFELGRERRDGGKQTGGLRAEKAGSTFTQANVDTHSPRL
jgi:hypothetical protein